MGRYRVIGRTFSSGHQNRLKKQKLDYFLKTQRGAMDKFNIVTSSPPIDINVHKNDKVTNTITKSNAISSCSPLFLRMLVILMLNHLLQKLINLKLINQLCFQFKTS